MTPSQADASAQLRPATGPVLRAIIPRNLVCYELAQWRNRRQIAAVAQQV